MKSKDKSRTANQKRRSKKSHHDQSISASTKHRSKQHLPRYFQKAARYAEVIENEVHDKSDK